MAGQLDEILRHRNIYVPRGTSKDTIERGKQLALAVAREHRARLTVVAPHKAATTHHPQLAKLDIMTERSGNPSDGGVVLAWCPTYKTMEKVQRLTSTVVVLVEWIPGEFDAWAKLVGAYNVMTEEVMDARLSAGASKALEGVVREGYNGWTKSTDQRVTLSYLKDLHTVGAYDRDLVLAYARQSKSEDSIDRLGRILDEFEAAQGRPAASPGAPFPTTRTW